MRCPEDDAETLVQWALEQALLVSDDPAFKEWCHAYLAGTAAGRSEQAARRALIAIWPELALWSLEETLERMEKEGLMSLRWAGTARWAIGGAARAAWELVWTRHVGGELGAQRERQIGLMAWQAIRFAEVALSTPPDRRLRSR
jgi:hypothetical protein